ncbi:MAG: hypothetical protein QM784_37290 [Polyangiaceae bacterium]
MVLLDFGATVTVHGERVTFSTFFLMVAQKRHPLATLRSGVIEVFAQDRGVRLRIRFNVRLTFLLPLAITSIAAASLHWSALVLSTAIGAILVVFERVDITGRIERELRLALAPGEDHPTC